MSQAKVLDILKANPDKWMNTEELKDIMDINKNNTQSNLRKLRLSSLVEYKTKKVKTASNTRKIFLYKHKVRT